MRWRQLGLLRFAALTSRLQVETAIKVCRQAGYHEHALYLAKRHHEHAWYLKILLDVSLEEEEERGFGASERCCIRI